MDISGLNSVTTASEMMVWLTSNCITPIQPAMSGADFGGIMQKLLEVSGSGGSGLVLFDTKTANYTLELNDKAIDMNIGSANTLTIPPGSISDIPVGTQILITQSGTGQTTLVPGAGVTVNAPDGKLSLRTQFSSVTVIKRDNDTWILSGDVASTPLPVIKAAKVNLTEAGYEAISAGWNNNLNMLTLGSPLSLLNSDSSATGWSIIASVGTAGTLVFEHLADVPFGNTDFPDDVLDTLWYIENGTNFSFILSGLDNEKVYTVKTCAADNGTGDGQAKVTVGGVSQVGASPDNAAIELTFTEVTVDDTGNLSIIIDNTAGADYPLLNAIIITEH